MEDSTAEQGKAASSNPLAPPKSPAPGPRLSMRPATASPRSASKLNGTSTQPLTSTSPTKDKDKDKDTRTDDEPASMAPATHLNGKHAADDGDADSELSDPDSNVNSPPHGLADEIVVSNRDDRDLPSSPLQGPSDDEDENMTDARDEHISPYPKRRRAPTFNDSYDPRADLANGEPKAAASAGKPKGPKPGVGGVKGVTIGYWRDAPVPEEDRKHAVIGFIDVRDRLRTRIQPINLRGEQISLTYSLPPGPGGSWVTFERIVFLDHLVGLDQSQIKEYVRIRADTREESVEDQKAAEKAAVKEAINRVMNNPVDNPATQPAIAYGLSIPDHVATPLRPDAKRRKTSTGFTPITPAPGTNEPSRPSSQGASARQYLDPLPGTRPTRIPLGYWTKSDAPDPVDRHAVYGILGGNDMFRVKLVRETRDGRFHEGNFPQGAGALWINYEDVTMEDFLQHLSRQEIKEYCRVRQYQLDHGETPDERKANEEKAVVEAQKRVNSMMLGASKYNYVATDTGGTASAPDTPVQANGGAFGQELRTSRRTEARLLAQAHASAQAEAESQTQEHTRPQQERSNRADGRPEARTRRTLGGADTPPVGRNSLGNKANALAQREISRAEATQHRADVYASHRERAAAVAAKEASAAAASTSNGTNGIRSFASNDDLERLNSVWARQESLRARHGAEDAKVYDGRKYERKSTGPFVGKLASQGSLINIDGEDYIEYRILMKPTFY